MFGLFTESGILVFFLYFIFLCPTKMEAGNAQSRHSEIPSNLRKPWNHCMDIVRNNGGIADLETLLRQYPNLACQKDDRGMSPLIKAILQGNENAVALLLNYMDPEELNAQNFNGSPALFIAMEKEDKGIVTLLLIHGADVNNVHNREGFNAFQFSCTLKTPEMFYFMGSAVEKINELRKLHSENGIKLDKNSI